MHARTRRLSLFAVLFALLCTFVLLLAPAASAQYPMDPWHELQQVREDLGKARQRVEAANLGDDQLEKVDAAIALGRLERRERKLEERLGVRPTEPVGPEEAPPSTGGVGTLDTAMQILRARWDLDWYTVQEALLEEAASRLPEDADTQRGLGEVRYMKQDAKRRLEELAGEPAPEPGPDDDGDAGTGATGKDAGKDKEGEPAQDGTATPNAEALLTGDERADMTTEPNPGTGTSGDGPCTASCRAPEQSPPNQIFTPSPGEAGAEVTLPEDLPEDPGEHGKIGGGVTAGDIDWPDTLPGGSAGDCRPSRHVLVACPAADGGDVGKQAVLGAGTVAPDPFATTSLVVASPAPSLLLPDLMPAATAAAVTATDLPALFGPVGTVTHLDQSGAGAEGATATVGDEGAPPRSPAQPGAVAACPAEAAVSEAAGCRGLAAG